MKNVLAIIGNLLAIAIYGVGLISPLTPSEGAPTFGALLVFVGLPLALLLNSWRVYTNQFAKYAVALQGACMVGLTGWLLAVISGVFVSAS